VEVPVDHVVDVIAVRHRLVAAAWPVTMVVRVPAARVPLRADCRIRVGHRQLVLVDMIAVHVVHVPIVQVIGVSFVIDLGVPAPHAMRVRVAAVRRACTHGAIGSIRAFRIKRARRSR
jgi:hypothetical protein